MDNIGKLYYGFLFFCICFLVNLLNYMVEIWYGMGRGNNFLDFIVCGIFLFNPWVVFWRKKCYPILG